MNLAFGAGFAVARVGPKQATTLASSAISECIDNLEQVYKPSTIMVRCRDTERGRDREGERVFRSIQDVLLSQPGLGECTVDRIVTMSGPSVARQCDSSKQTSAPCAA